MSKYSEKLKDVRWQKRRLEILERDEWTCQVCGATTGSMHVHHMYYEPGVEPWDHPSPSMITLCEDCHAAEREDWRSAARWLHIQLSHIGFTSSDRIALGSSIHRAAVSERAGFREIGAALRLAIQDDMFWARLVHEYSEKIDDAED